MFIPLTTAVAALAAAPTITPDSSASLIARSGTTCSTNGALICGGGGSQYALCNWGHAVFQPVAAGTICVCAHDNDELCTIASADQSSPSTPLPPPPPASHPPPPVTTHKPAPSPPPAPSSPPSSSPAPPAPSNSAGGSSPVPYKMYQGNGSPAEGWPTMSDWREFDDLWTANQGRITSSCAAFGQKNNSPQETEDLRKAILQVSKECGVDSRFTLAAVLQESGGCVRVPTTTYSVSNPGLLQSHNGTHSCFNKDPCPDSEIIGMLHDGIDGTTAGPGFKQLMKTVGTSGAQQYYRTARAYNSGSVAADGNLGEGVATHCYCSDIANRLSGWSTGDSTCTLDG